MGVEYYLIKPFNKTIYELGKGDYYFLEDLLNAAPSLTSVDRSIDPVDTFIIEHPSIIAEYFIETRGIKDEETINYWYEVFQDICNWAEGSPVFLISDSYDFTYECKRELGYTQTGTRFR